MADPKQWPPESQELKQALHNASLEKEYINQALDLLGKAHLLGGQVREALDAFHTADANHALFPDKERRPSRIVVIYALVYVKFGDTWFLRLFLDPEQLMEVFHLETKNTYKDQPYPLEAFNKEGRRQDEHTYWKVYECSLDGKSVEIGDMILRRAQTT